MRRGINQKPTAIEEKKTVQRLGAVANDLQLKSENLSKELIEKEKKILKAKDQTVILSGSIKKLEEKLKVKEQALEDIQKKIDAIKQEHGRQDALLKIKTLEGRKEMENTLNDLSLKILQLKKEAANNTALITTQKNSLATFSQQVLDLYSTLESLRNEEKQLDKKILTLGKTLEQKTGILNAVNDELTRLDVVRESKLKETFHWDELLQDQASAIEQNQKTINEQGEIIKKSQAEVVKIKKQIEDMTMTIGNVNIQKHKNEQFAQRLQKKAEQMGINIKLD